MDEPLWRLEQPKLTIERLPRQTIFVLRLRRPDVWTRAAFTKAIGDALPTEPNSVIDRETRLVWLSPSEWMITGGGGAIEALAAALGSATGHVADVGEGKVQFDIGGDLARDLLAKGTSLDLHASVLLAGHCAQTIFAQTSLLIERYRVDDKFLLTADISFADHLQRWFEDAAIEFRKEKAVA